MGILEKIIENKRREVESSKKNFPLSGFKDSLRNSRRDFKKALSKNKLSLIAEIKRKSPSRNLHNKAVNIKKIAKVYDRHADAISVLTDKKFFGGSLADLRYVSKITKLPVLRKDFIIDEYQVYESRLYDADAILLIASALPMGRLNRFIRIAEIYNMDCLVEVSTEKELNKALKTKASIIGINNRDLDTLKIDTGTTLRLMDRIPSHKVVVSESGISSKECLKKIGKKVDAVLVGSLFMNSKKPEKEIMSLIK